MAPGETLAGKVVSSLSEFGAMSLSQIIVTARAVAAALLLVPALTAAQETPTGRIVGRVVDAKSGAGIQAAGVQIVGTTIGTQSGIDGRFTLLKVPAGTVTLQVRRIGYNAKTVTGLQLEAGGVLEQNVSLDGATVQLQATVVTAEKERGSVSAALDQQRNATQIVNAITSEQIAKSPDGDAAAAVQRVSGVTVQDGKYVFVRGLGERYTTASLNGARIPSPEPERKVVPLDLFPSGILQSITTSKTFTPDLQGDFSGAQVDIKTREFPAKRQFTYSFSSGFNDAATGQQVLRAPRQGGEYLALIGDKRNMPSTLQGVNFTSLNQLGVNRIVRSMTSSWSPTQATGLPQGSMSASAGGSDPIFGQPIGYLLSASYSAAQEIKRDHRFAIGNAGAGGTVVPQSQYAGETGRVSALWGGIANFSTLLGTSTRVAFNNTYSKTSDNDAHQDVGFNENLADTVRRTTLRYVERGIWSSQLAVEQQAGSHALDYSVTGSGTSRREPDRSDMAHLVRNVGGVRSFLLLGSDLDGARRSYFDLSERNIALQVNDRWAIGDVSSGNAVKFGAYFRGTSRESKAPSYSIITTGLQPAPLSLPLEQLISPTYACDACTNFNLQPIGQAGDYDAKDRLIAGYMMADWALGKRTRLIGGARIENANIEVNTVTQLGARFNATIRNTDLLPSLALNTALSSTQNLRVSVSQTLARPEYRELSPVQFRDVLGGISVTGNANLRRSLIQNADVRWEYFPSSSEVFSLGGFVKRFDSPIERIEVPSSGGVNATYVNAQSALNYGLELEARTGLGRVTDALEDLTVFSNVTVMTSSIDLAAAGGGNLSNPNRAMVGQAPFVVNAGITYNSRSGRTSTTLLYNVVGRRIFAAGLLPLPDVYEEPRNMVDLSVRFPVMKSLDARFDARNLMDAEYRFTQGTIVREAYRAGRVVSVGLSWRP